ncbi:regulatory protein RecX [Microbacterium sp. RD1]|uniref:regulatory protein RecX n=1 Tax=Microbacterium sp. RD1 TaxID=3457313 RepID=UPI003FA58530
MTSWPLAAPPEMSSHNGGERDALAPVIPLFGAASPPQDEGEVPGWHATWVADTPQEVPEPSDLIAAAEKTLLRKLRTRSLSLREARSALAEADLAPGQVEAVLDRFVGLGYLDDRALAEQLIDKALSRKSQGRSAIAQTLAQRGIPRDVVDAALDELPDDEVDRALEFARAKAPQLSDLDHDVALRRLAGQLARRGFGSRALSVARQALEESRVRPRGVRFD